MKDPSDDPSTKYNINYLGGFFFVTTVTFFRERERDREREGGGGGGGGGIITNNIVNLFISQLFPL